MTTDGRKMMAYSKRSNPLDKHMEEKAHQYTSKRIEEYKNFIV